MKLRRIITNGFIVILALGHFNLKAQSLADGLRFSQTINNGTARFVSMGGALVH
jgi:hypothetical protein